MENTTEESLNLIVEDNKEMQLQELLSKIKIRYNENTDTVSIACDSNLIIQSNRNILISKDETIILSGEALGFKGKLSLNPIINKIKEMKKLFN